MESAIQFENVSFAYPKRDIEVVDDAVTTVENPDETTQVFGNISADLPQGVMSLVGQNGVGKSTLLLLAGARIFPQTGSVTILGTNTEDFYDAGVDPEVEERRNRLVSFVYQNMEFETSDSVGDLMTLVFESGRFPEGPIDKTKELLPALRREFEMEEFLHLTTQKLSKGQLQRAIMALSLLYGSRIIMMDEPVFALEDNQKDRAFEYLMHYAATYGVSLYYSAHNLELTERYSDYLLLFSQGGDFQVGLTAELFTKENIELAYHAPFDTLHKRDLFYREMLTRDISSDK